MKAYLTGVLCAAFLCSILNAFGDAGKGPRKLITGLFLALSLLHPLGSLELSDWSLDPYLEEAEDAVRSGTEQAQKARNDIITDSLEAYILTKASGLGISIDAGVSLDADGNITSITMTGPVSPSEREALSDALTCDLDLREEDLIWRSAYQSSE